MTTLYPLGALQQFDDRSLNYSVKKKLTIDELEKPVTKEWPCYACLDQGSVPSCVGNAQAHDLAANPVVVLGVTEAIANNIYNQAQQIDGWPLPHNGTSVLAGMKALKMLYPEAVGDYHWAFTLKDALASISHLGPVIVGTVWYNSMFYPNAKGRVNIEGAIAGRHSYLIRGIDMERGWVICRNSWGKNWGKKGDFFMEFKTLEKLLNNGGECLVPTNRKLVTV